MEAYSTTAPHWDTTTSFSQLPDEDFLALLHKQFPTAIDSQIGIFTDDVNSHNNSNLPLPALTPPSEDSSPSPPNMNVESNTRAHSNFENDDPALKRKATDDDEDDEGPNQKNQHTSNGNKKAARRKSTDTGGGGGVEQSRLLKRKEQNRAAQRAFRERKEKHVKDLEDKVASLEAKNEQAASENENLRDLLARIQKENMILKEATFTFSVPKNAGSSAIEQPTPGMFAPQPSLSHDAPLNMFDGMSSSSSMTSSPPVPTPGPQNSLFSNDSFDWNSLMPLDPAVLNLLDDSSQLSAADNSIQVDFGFDSALSPKLPYTTIASNPEFMSFADAFEGSSVVPLDDASFNFDLQSWSTPAQSANETRPLDDLFNGGYMPQQPRPFDYGSNVASPASFVSPVLHATTSRPNLVSSSSTPESSTASIFSKPRDSSASISDEDIVPTHPNKCPRSKEELQQHIDESGLSPFAPSVSIRKSPGEKASAVIDCQGAVLPKTQKSDQNVEVLTAWRSITSNPMFKDADITELCSEFTKKARCDGEKVVLEPSGVNHIIEKLKRQRS